MASPSNSAIGKIRIFGADFTASVAKIESVTTSSFNLDDATLSAASPDNTPSFYESPTKS